MLTADTITDEQIRELRKDVLYERRPEYISLPDREIGALLHTFDLALYGGSEALARCAEILNSRQT